MEINGVTDVADRIRELLGDAGWREPLAFFEARLSNSGRPTGIYKVCSFEEGLAIAGLLGRPCLPGKKVAARQVDSALQTAFGVSLREALVIIRNQPIVTRPELRAASAAAWGEAFSRLCAVLDRSGVTQERKDRLAAWLEEQVPDFKTRHTRNAAQLDADWLLAVRALEHLPAEGIMGLANLANRAVGNSHALDLRQSGGMLFYRALAVIHPEVEDPLGRGVEGQDELLTAAGVARDRTSAKVDTFGLRSSDPTLDAVLTRSPVMTLTIRSIENYRPFGLFAGAGEAWVVENSSVFDELAERLSHLPNNRWPTLICTNGRLNLADRLLLGDLSRGGAELRYSGDFDAAGVEIADEILCRYSPRARLWRMDQMDYFTSLKDGAPPLDSVTTPRSPQLQALASALNSRRVAAFQEGLIDNLYADMLD